MILGGAPVTPALVNLSNEKIPNSKVIVGYGMTGESFKPIANYSFLSVI